jgi:hypothetical protein
MHRFAASIRADVLQTNAHQEHPMSITGSQFSVSETSFVRGRLANLAQPTSSPTLLVSNPEQDE